MGWGSVVRVHGLEFNGENVWGWDSVLRVQGLGFSGER